MDARTVTLYAFCSAKGGVGKSTLAVVAAKLLAAQGRACALIDADLTGTSLADGLGLRAPRVALDDGGLMLEAPPTGEHFSLEETQRLRDARDRVDPEQWPPPPPPFFNDALLFYRSEEQTTECRLDALFWRHEREDKVLYLPSSPLPRDVSVALGWLYQDGSQWLSRFAWLIDALCTQVPALTDVVIDLPPGLYGFTRDTLTLMSRVSLGLPLPEGSPDWPHDGLTFRVRPFLVMTEDSNDLAVALEYFAANYPRLRELVPLVNRERVGLRATSERVQKRFEQRLGRLNLESHLVGVSESPLLAKIFVDNDVRVDKMSEEEQRSLRRSLRLEG
ncbi:MAG TPA: P-loop NTPase [Candidatus Nanopelagicales bacterium]|nr:P-loop NTPase [Candidatus Nanopelagicales bacterium]